MNKSDIPVIAGDYRLEEFDGELLLYHPATTRTLHMNDSATLIWNLCNGKRTIQDIVATLAEAYPESVESIENDVMQTIKNLSDNGVLSLG